MPLVPLPFVVAFLLGIVLVRLLLHDPRGPNRWLLAMIGAYALQSVLAGLRWGYGIEDVRPAQAVLGATLPPLSWITFSGFQAAYARAGHGLWWHVLPSLLAALLWWRAPWMLDPFLVLLLASYGTALIHLGRGGSDRLDRVTLDGAVPLHRALQATGVMLIASAVADAAISLDRLRTGGLQGGWIVALSSLSFIALLGLAAAMAGSAPVAEKEEVTSPHAAADPRLDDLADASIVDALNGMIRSRALHHDPELSLDRLSRRMGMPARRISLAINRTEAMNVSQYVNAHRVADACRLLAETNRSITQILFEVGFQTKSNFNREFLRITGMSPSAWRTSQQVADRGGETAREIIESQPLSLLPPSRARNARP